MLEDNSCYFFLLGDNTIIPWLLSVKHGTALEVKENKILIKENGLFFVYSQVKFFVVMYRTGKWGKWVHDVYHFH